MTSVNIHNIAHNLSISCRSCWRTACLCISCMFGVWLSVSLNQQINLTKHCIFPINIDFSHGWYIAIKRCHTCMLQRHAEDIFKIYDKFRIKNMIMSFQNHLSNSLPCIKLHDNVLPKSFTKFIAMHHAFS